MRVKASICHCLNVTNGEMLEKIAFAQGSPSAGIPSAD